MAHSGRESLWEEIAGGLRRLLGGSWPGEDRPIAALLDLLVRGSKLQDDVRVLEAEAPALSVREPQAEEERLVREELETARADLPEFERALVDAWRRSGGTAAEVRYDTADAEQNRAADVLIRYLVTTRAADVRSEEREPGQYVYYLAVDWELLFALAAHLDLDLRRALERGADTGTSA